MVELPDDAEDVKERVQQHLHGDGPDLDAEEYDNPFGLRSDDWEGDRDR